MRPMCGRYSLNSPAEVLIDHFQIEEDLGEELSPRYNVPPGTDCPVVGQAPEGHRKLRMLRWGLLPSWAKDPRMAYKMINARAETVASKPAYRAALRKRRVLVPCDGFFEWRKEGGGKQPYFLHAADGKPLAMAGIWERWKDPGGEAEVFSFSVVTTEASPDIAEIHHRMPVLLAPDAWDLWVDRGVQDPEAVQGLLVPAPEGTLAFHPVSKRVGSVKNDDPELLEPVEGPA